MGKDDRRDFWTAVFILLTSYITVFGAGVALGEATTKKDFQKKLADEREKNTQRIR